MKSIAKSARYTVVLAALAVLLSGCGSGVQFVRQDMTEYPPKPGDAHIDIYDSGVTRPHVVIGTLRAGKKMKASFNDKSTYDEVMDSLVRYARKVGADALAEVKPVDQGRSTDTRIELTATAVRYMRRHQTVTSN